MSKNNTIIILETNGPEFRVADIQASDNIFYYDETGDIMRLWSYFNHCSVVRTLDTADKIADTLATQDIEDTGWGPEYGIQHLRIEKDFPESKPPCPDHSLSTKYEPPMCLRCMEH